MAEKKDIEDNLAVSKKIVQDQDDEHEMKINKINKELSNHKVLLEEALKENS